MGNPLVEACDWAAFLFDQAREALANGDIADAASLLADIEDLDEADFAIAGDDDDEDDELEPVASDGAISRADLNLAYAMAGECLNLLRSGAPPSDIARRAECFARPKFPSLDHCQQRYAAAMAARSAPEAS